MPNCAAKALAFVSVAGAFPVIWQRPSPPSRLVFTHIFREMRALFVA